MELQMFSNLRENLSMLKTVLLKAAALCWNTNFSDLED